MRSFKMGPLLKNWDWCERTSQRLVSLWNCSCRSNPFQLHHHWHLMRPRYHIIIKPVNDGDPLFSMVTSPKFRLLIKHCILFRQWHATCYLPRVDLFSDSCCCHLLSPKHRQWNSDGGMRILTCSEDQYRRGGIGQILFLFAKIATRLTNRLSDLVRSLTSHGWKSEPSSTIHMLFNCFAWNPVGMQK